ncbi:DUF6640 family protein, partial [Amycolatopsis sp. NPDC059021]|uniref:DUF6640 family protein n=1 Tax=Amycolatopsis sp. NPDC059021 TaxID=3346704 RepID=UPI00366D9322
MRVPRLRGRGLGRVLISVTSLATAVGPYKADWNETHVHNPAWPPHAKFHNGQTMSLGLALGVGSLYQLWRAPGAARPSQATPAPPGGRFGGTPLWARADPGP